MHRHFLYSLSERFLLSTSYIWFFSVYPVMTLFANNIGQVVYLAFLPSLIGMIGLTAFLLLLMNLLTKDRHVAALMVAVFIILMVSYGHLVVFLFNRGMRLSLERFIWIWLTLLTLLLTMIFVLSKKVRYDLLAPSLNLIAVVLMMFPTARIIRYALMMARPFTFQTDHYQKLRPVSPSPDIYYIILDGYTRSDVYKFYGFDNSDFIHDLEAMGFYVAKCSQSNYPNTGLSLTSALNMDYIPNLSTKFNPAETELLYLFKALQRNAVRRILEDVGYRTVAYASGFPWAEMRNADIYYAPTYNLFSEFDVVFFKTTAFRVLDDWGWINIDNVRGERYRERTRLVLDSFQELPRIPGPKFVFMHILASHEPFVFDAEGNPLDPDLAGDKGYVEASAFISAQIVYHLRRLIEQSSVQPVIILQGDHGPYTANDSWRLSILNAYYLPGGYSAVLYPTITPVNSFRIVFNSYFGADYPLLEDRSYVSSLPRTYDFTYVPNECVP